MESIDEDIDASERKAREEMKMGFELRPNAQVYSSYKAYQRAQNQSSRAVTIGKFIAFFVGWEGSTPTKPQLFWVGKVVDISETAITVHYYHTSGTNYARAVFKPWTGKDKQVHTDRENVIDVFDQLTSSGLLPAKHRRYILDKVDQKQNNTAQPGFSDSVLESTGYEVSDLDEKEKKSRTRKRKGLSQKTKSKKKRKSKRLNRSTSKKSTTRRKRKSGRSSSSSSSIRKT